jgi:hypothetical protein
MVTTPQEEAISKLKEEVLSALTALYLHGDRVPQVPTAKTVDDFELCRTVKEKGKPTGDYELLDHASGRVKDHLANWDSVYIRFRDESGTPSTSCLPLSTTTNLSERTFCEGDLQPVEVEVPILVEEDEEEPAPIASSSKGKRKTPE